MTNHHKPWLSHYDPGVPKTIEIPEISLVDLFQHTAAEYGEKCCTIFNGEALSYAEIADLSDRLARFLLARGLQKGERVGILLPNSPEFVIGYYGILKAGGVVMALNPAYRLPEVESQALESEMRFLLTAGSRYDFAISLKDKTSLEGLIIAGGNPPSLQEGDISLSYLFKTYEKGARIEIPVSPEDPAVFQYSGGTTGTPKCAVGLHRNLVANVYQFSHWLVNAKSNEERILVAIPMYHVYGMVLGMNLAVKIGASMILISDPRNMNGLLEAIQTYQATIFPGVPNLYAAINRFPAVKAGNYDLSSVKACISGSAPLPLRVKEEFEALTHGHLVEGYGLSEAPTATHCNPILGENRAGSIGLPLSNVDARIVDLETGTRELPVGQSGELVVKGPQVMAGYHNQPAETDLVLQDGWLYTGDVARMDTDGYFYLVDRKKDVIKVGGFQVWPNEVEAVLLQYPNVREAAVAGVTDADGAEVAKAWIVLQEGVECDPVAVQEFCGEKLTSYKVPRYIEFRDSLPRTAVGKILRWVLVKEHHST